MFRALFRRSEVRLFFTISVLFYICIHSIDAFLAPMLVSEGMQPEVVGMIMGASGLATLFVRFPIGILSDVVKSRKIFIQFSLLLPLVTWPIAYLEPNATTLYLAKAADGFTAATWVLYNILFIRYFDRKDAPAAVALLALAGPLGVFLGNCIGGALIHFFDKNIAYFVSSVAALLALILTTRIKETHDAARAPTLRACITSAKRQLSDGSVWFIGLLATVVILVPFATRDTLTPIYAQQLGAKAGILTLLSNLHLIFYALAIALCSSVFYKRLGLVNTAIIGIFLQLISTVGVPFTSNMYLIYLLQSIGGFSFGMAFAVFMSLSVVNTVEDEQSTRMGLFQTIYSCGMFVGPVLMGLMLQHINLSSGYLLIGVLTFIAMLLTPLAARSVNQRQNKMALSHAATGKMTTAQNYGNKA
ncbi:MFS transporter [Enterobacteriaceae bacterium H20N1]|uniref:MFS transporter n=1 Tax=Dryocola boscaweniae TaxID=2925397 RepID=A0A9X2WAD9_9ENTR|nr:MFS transporter [Dryocola boscaweniae]MCT4704006.1 MFS transporter [Dryocola boscaweniae]MCT4721174.1 MFS transporter [Dryocola boscaweniae]